MGLKSEIEKAYIDSLGVDPENSGNIPQLAEDLSNAITNFLLKQTFTITEMKAILEVEEMKTTGPLDADVLQNVEVRGQGKGNAKGTGNQGAPVFSTVDTQTKGNVSKGKKGVRIPKIDYNKNGAQGGQLMTLGHSYIGDNPVSNEKNDTIAENKVKLLEENIVGK